MKIRNCSKQCVILCDTGLTLCDACRDVAVERKRQIRHRSRFLRSASHRRHLRHLNRMQVDSAAVTTNGDVTMVNIYAAENPGVTTSTDSTADSGNTDNSENTDDSSSTDDSENISESDSSDQDDNSEDSYDYEDQGDNSEE